MGWKRKRLEALEDEDLKDVHLVGTDDEEVACSKMILATQSPVFKSMFFRGFREQKADRCRLEFHSVVIGLVVKYCYCGQLDISTTIIGKTRSYQERAALLVELREAGRYFELEEVKSYAENQIGVHVFQRCNSQYACAFLNELFKRGEDDGPFWSAIFEFAVENADKCFGKPSGIVFDTTCHSHAFVLVKVLEKVRDTFIVVNCLQAWLLREDMKGGGSSDKEKQALVDFAKNVDLKKLSANQLSQLFKERSCPLFPSDNILEAVFHKFQGQESPRPRPKTKRRFYVSGAGLGVLNGFYSQMNCGEKKMNIFTKHGDSGVCIASIQHIVSQKPAANDNVVPYVHRHHTCDSCRIGPIVGARYHAVNLRDYDLCENCHRNYAGTSIEFISYPIGNKVPAPGDAVPLHLLPFRIHYKHTEMKWLLSITTKTGVLQLDDNGDVKEGNIHFHAYEAAGNSESVPFNNWKRLKGAGPAPFVAQIDG